MRRRENVRVILPPWYHFTRIVQAPFNSPIYSTYSTYTVCTTYQFGVNHENKSDRTEKHQFATSSNRPQLHMRSFLHLFLLFSFTFTGCKGSFSCIWANFEANQECGEPKQLVKRNKIETSLVHSIFQCD